MNTVLSYLIYGVLALIALWGAFCIIMVWMRIVQKRFRNDQEQAEFLDALAEPLAKGDYRAAAELCEGDPRALVQLARLAIAERAVGYAKLRQLVVDRFQSDVLSDLEFRLSWVNTVIKGAPMVGLFGTVVGMLGAFHKLTTATAPNPATFAGDISLALVTTAMGLAIAIPLVFCTAFINVRIRKMEELVGAGLTHFLEDYRLTLAEFPPKPVRKSRGASSPDATAGPGSKVSPKTPAPLPEATPAPQQEG